MTFIRYSLLFLVLGSSTLTHAGFFDSIKEAASKLDQTVKNVVNYEEQENQQSNNQDTYQNQSQNQASQNQNIPQYRQVSRGTVLDIQYGLNERGYDAGTPDGLMGAKTRQAIKYFQEDHGIYVDGKPSNELLATLNKTPLPERKRPTKQLLTTNEKHQTDSNDYSSTGITGKGLMAEFRQSEKDANTKYANRKITITSDVAYIDKKKRKQISLSAGKKGFIMCRSFLNLDTRLFDKLSIGQTVTLTATLTKGNTHTIYMKNCIFRNQTNIASGTEKKHNDVAAAKQETNSEADSINYSSGPKKSASVPSNTAKASNSVGSCMTACKGTPQATSCSSGCTNAHLLKSRDVAYQGCPPATTNSGVACRQGVDFYFGNPSSFVSRSVKNDNETAAKQEPNSIDYSSSSKDSASIQEDSESIQLSF